MYDFKHLKMGLEVSNENDYTPVNSSQAALLHDDYDLCSQNPE